ncbi:serine/threonine-protein kinase [Hyalangium versicolor]|uniref:serine/threonine-protein kinase n=1 Tax=Hyalangium versicolor TaxID=2861190 RepID=UPI001CCB3CE2|nr:protein kinase [Hyalangium versicolor]
MTPGPAASSLIFGKYALLRRLAAGGMGEIYLARQVGVSGFDRPVILKSLLPELLEQEGSVDMFLDEARVAGRLNHPNVVAVYEVGEWQGTFYIAMEYIEGEDLVKLARAARRNGAPLSPRICAEVIRDAALGLDHAHHATDPRGAPLQIVHRDISPQNIMVRLDGVTKVVDFGVAKAANRVTRTATGMVKGKFRYMSPEQIRGLQLDGRSDQFALGAVLWELCTNRPLFEGEAPVDIMRRIVGAPAPRPSQVLTDGLHPMLESIILRMLDRNRDARFARCADIARALQTYLDETPLPSGDNVSSVVTRHVGESVRARWTEAMTELDPNLPSKASDSTLRCPRCGLVTSRLNRFCPQCGSAFVATGIPQQPLGQSDTSPTVTQGIRIDVETAPPTQSPMTVPERPLALVRDASRATDAHPLKRKLAIVSVKLEGVEALRQRLGEEAGLEAVSRLLELPALAADRHSAEVLLLTEERWCLAFGLPAAQQDDPLRAVRCALELRQAVADLGLEPAPVLRLGIDFGITLVSGGQGRSPWRATGAGLDRATAVANAATPGELLAGAALRTLLESKVQFGQARSLGGTEESAYRIEALGGKARAALPWVGRAEALASAEAVVERARKRMGGARLFLGTPGMGKSRLMEAVAERAARATPLRVLSASGEEAAAAGVMGLVRVLLLRLAQLLGPAPTSEPLAPLVKLGFSSVEISAAWRRLSQGGAAGQLQAGNAALADILHKATQPTGLLLLIDDLHRADASSLEFLGAVLTAPGSQVALVGTTTPDALPSRLVALPVTHLEGLPRGELRSLLTVAFGGPLSPEVESLLADRSRGNPSFALELMRSLVEGGALHLLGGQWQATAPLTQTTLPDSLALVLSARLDRLLLEAQRFLSRAAVEGKSFSSALIAASLREDTGGPSVVEALIMEGWLVPVAEGTDTLRFGQDLTREVLLSRLPQSMLRSSHQALAEALERDTFASEPARLVRIADHLLAAASPRAAAACEKAGDWLAARGEWRTATEYLRRTLGDAPGATPPEQQRQLEVLARAASCLAQVDPAAIDALVTPWLDRIPATRAPSAWAEVVRRQATAELKLGRIPDAEARLTAAQGLVSADPELEGWILGDLARVREARGDFAGASALLIQAFQRMGGKPARNPDFYWEHLNLLGRLQHRLGKPDQARVSFTRAHEQARGASSAMGQAKALSNLAGLKSLSGESAAALGDLERALALAQQAGDVQEVARIHYNAGRILVAVGRAPEGRDRLEKARDRARLAGWREGEALAIQSLDSLSARPPS